MASNNHTLLGKIAKTHGVKGELIIRTRDPSFDLKENWESIFLRIEGILVPFFISSLRAFRDGEWVVRFDWYGDKDRAQELVGHEVWVEARFLQQEDREVFPDGLVGCEFRDSGSGRSGTITAFVNIPENPLFEAETGGETIMIPAREEFIVRFDPELKSVVFDLPAGLF